MRKAKNKSYFTVTDVAHQLGVSAATVYRWKMLGMIKPSNTDSGMHFFTQKDIDNRIKSGPRGRGGSEEERQKRIKRDKKFIALYKNGKTLQEIGVRFGITRERVRQCLFRNGIKFTDGGFHINTLSRCAMREKATQEQREFRSKKKWGLSIKENQNLRAKFNPLKMDKFAKVYILLKKRSQREKIPWAINLKDFVNLMKDKISFYGKGELVVHRIITEKGYVVGNIECITHSESATLTRRQEQVMKLYNNNKGPMEIATILGISRGTVATTINHAKTRIKLNQRVGL